MSFQRLSLAFILVLWSSLALAEVIQPTSLRAESSANGVLVKWTSEDETGVAGYMIERQAGASGGFIPMLSQKIIAKGNRQSYEFADETAFKATGNFYTYRLTPVTDAGRPVGNSYYVSINQNPSDVRRTWGSIKAMFR